MYHIRPAQCQTQFFASEDSYGNNIWRQFAVEFAAAIVACLGGVNKAANCGFGQRRFNFGEAKNKVTCLVGEAERGQCPFDQKPVDQLSKIGRNHNWPLQTTRKRLRPDSNCYPLGIRLDPDTTSRQPPPEIRHQMPIGISNKPDQSLNRQSLPGRHTGPLRTALALVMFGRIGIGGFGRLGDATGTSQEVVLLWASKTSLRVKDQP